MSQTKNSPTTFIMIVLAMAVFFFVFNQAKSAQEMIDLKNQVIVFEEGTAKSEIAYQDDVPYSGWKMDTQLVSAFNQMNFDNEQALECLDFLATCPRNETTVLKLQCNEECVYE